MLLSDRDIKAEIESGRVKLDPYAPELIQPSSVDVRMDRYFRVFENHRYPHIDPAIEQPDLTRLIETDGDDPFVLHPGEFVLASTYEVVSLPDDVAGRLEGKALAIDTPIPTPGGWRTMGDLRTGDEVFDEHGGPTQIVATTAIMVDRACAEVVFSDGQSIVTDLDHQWLTTTRAERRRGLPGSVRTTREIAGALRAADEWNHRVELAGPVGYPVQRLPVDPCTLGGWLGDQRMRHQPRMPQHLRAADALDVLGHPYVPEPYLRAGIEQRRALLTGLLDSGTNDGREFITTSERLADAAAELAASLGLRSAKRKMRLTRRGVQQAPAYQVRFAAANAANAARAIVAVRATFSRPVRCVQVANPAGLYLAGPAFIPTHNSSLGRLGLLTHSTAGWIDPGFSGHVTLELSNVATLPIKLWPGMKIGQLCLFRTSSPSEHPYGSAIYGSRYQDQRGPTPSRSYLNFYRTKV